MGATKEQAEKTRQHLLDAALNVFSNKGYNATRLEDIAKEAGVTRGAFYWHFKNKTEVFCELHRQIMNDFVNSMKSAIDDSRSSLLNLKNVFLKIISQLLNDENTRHCGKLLYMVEHTPNIKAAVKQIQEEQGFPVRALLSELINKGKVANEIRTDLETESVFRTTISMLRGTVDQILDDIFPLSENEIRTIVDIFIEGIKNRD